MYKTIVVHVDQTDPAMRCVDAAIQLAVRYDAHLVGACMTGLSPYLLPVGGFTVAPPLVAFPVEALRARADAALDVFEERARSNGLVAFERRRIDDEADMGLALQSRYCDLLIMARATVARLPRRHTGLAESVLLQGSGPVLLLPPQGLREGPFQAVTVGWNGSANAARAVRSAIGVLRDAAHVELLVYNAAAEPDLHGALPGAEMAAYLAHHGVNVTLSVRDTSVEAGQALLAHACDQESDLIVMGAFGHARLREWMVGGATRTALETSALPLWMAH